MWYFINLGKEGVKKLNDSFSSSPYSIGKTEHDEDRVYLNDKEENSLMFYDSNNFYIYFERIRKLPGEIKEDIKSKILKVRGLELVIKGWSKTISD